MKAKKVFSLVIALVISCLVFGTGSVALAAPDNGNGPPVNAVVIVHYPHQPHRVFAGALGEALVEQDGYGWDGTKWPDSTIKYSFNPGKQYDGYLDAVKASFAAWDAESALTVTYTGTTKSSPGSLQAKWNPRTGRYSGALNVVGWKNIAQYSGAIGVTYIWAAGTTVIEVDTALNSSSEFRWSQNPASGWTAANTTAYDVDVQNIMTHEAGHWLVLDDLYDTASASLTMYGYAGEFEIIKRTLEQGDIDGIKRIYG